jgi:hypothetical protein
LSVSIALDSYPVWSPDGAFLAFRSDRAGNIEVFTATATGSSPTNRTANSAVDCHPTWTDAPAAAVVAVPPSYRTRAPVAPGRLIRPGLGSRVIDEGSCLGR